MTKYNKNLYKIILIALVAVLVFFLPAIAGLYADIVWYKNIGFYSVFITPFITQLVTGAITFILVSGILLLNFWIFIKFSQGKLYISQNPGGTVIEQPREVGGLVKKGFIALSVFIGLLSGLSISNSWPIILKYIHQTPFEKTDPVLGYDISYYVFTLPFIQLIAGFLFFLLALCIIFTGIFYVWHILFHHFEQKVKYFKFFSLPYIPGTAKKHLTVLGVAWFLLTAFYLYTVSLPNLLLKDYDLLSGAKYVDLYGHLPVTYVLIAVSLLAVLAGIYMLFREKYGLWAPVLILYLIIFVLGGGVYPSLLQSLVVAPNELSKEHTNIENNIEATQKAWGLDKIITQKLSGDQELNLGDIENNRETIDNIRLWDREPLMNTFGQLQEIRTYYNFNSIDNSRYDLDGNYQQIALAAREIDYNNLPKRNFINERLTYTHGMGVAASPLSEATEEGLPILYVKDLPPKSDKKELEIEQPAIYYGENQSSYIIANTDSKEFHYPGREGNVYKNYEGKGGVALTSRLNRLLMAINFASYEIFLNTDINPDSKIIYYRNIQERVSKALPFLELDSDPYLIVVEGKLKWIQDAYTTTDRYPYSSDIDGINYMRNSVKIVVDAYDGSVDAYIMDEDDPIIRTYASIFPEIFQRSEDMPESIKDHIRYPEDLFSRQTILYGEYHMEDPQDFYNKEDLWNFPRLMGTTRRAELGPVMRRLIMKLPGEDKEEYVLMLPYTPEGRQNMISWIAARSDGENYGELINFRFPKESLAYGPQQIVARINQRTEISQQISLWDQRGSEVLQGNLYVIPIEESILYVRPLYLQAQDSRIPELKRVIVAHKESIAMEENLEKALMAVFEERGEEIDVGHKDDDEEILPQVQKEIQNLAEEINQLFEQSEEAQRQGDWGQYGEILEEMRDKIRQLRSQANL